MAVGQQIRNGVFFTSPAGLPRGRHAMTRAEVQSAQRERLMIAVTELTARDGYRAVGVREIAQAARVSLGAFYGCFADKDECMFAAYDRFISVVLARVSAVLEHPAVWEQTIAEVVGAYLSALEADPVVARAFQVEMDALGRPARDRRRQALTGLAQVLKDRCEEVFPDHPVLPLRHYVGVVYAIRQIASDELDLDPRTPLTSLTGELAAWAAASLATDTSRRIAPSAVPFERPPVLNHP